MSLPQSIDDGLSDFANGALLEKISDDPAAWALFVDVDGTLLDIAERPELVSIPEGVVDSLARINDGLGGAVAILTGRLIVSADRLLAPLHLVCAGVHGAELRRTINGPIGHLGQPLSPDFVEAVEAIALNAPGTRVELKDRGLAFHYRNAPGEADRIERELRALLVRHHGALRLARGRKVLELGPRGVSKATALATILRLPHFRARRPVMIGDDLGDAGAIDAAARLGGYGLRVAGEHFPRAGAAFAGPQQVRRWIGELGERLSRRGCMREQHR